MKIVISTCFGGFGLSNEASIRYASIKGLVVAPHDSKIERNDPALVQVVEELRDAANSRFSCLQVVEIPDDVDWKIEEYDGYEHIAEKHRTWP